MPRYRIPYSANALFAGPAPATGFHYITSSGFSPSPDGSFNLISYLNRVQNVSFEVSSPKTDVKSFGKYGSLRTYQTEPSTVNLNFEYLQIGVRNEDKLGLYVNFPKPESSSSGAPIFSDNDQVFLLSGFYTSDMSRSDRAYGWPLLYRDCRNLFFAISTEEGKDFNSINSSINNNLPSVFAFGNCYMTSYKAEASVGDFPKANVNYICDNLVFYSSGSGILNPSLSTSGTKSTNICNVPNNYENKQVAALTYGDILVDITSYPIQQSVSALQGTGTQQTQNQDITNFGISYTGIQLQSYSISIDLPRRPVKSLTYTIPKNRKLTFPIKASVSFNAIVNTLNTGDIYNIFRLEDEYDINIKIANPLWDNLTGTAVYYKIKRAKLLSHSYSESIGENLTCQVNMMTEMTPSDLSRGLFISGQYNTIESTNTAGYLLQENGFRILQEDNSRIVVLDDTFLV